MTRTTVYVDGLNLYYGALRHTDYKWLDLAAFGRKLISASDQLVTVKYFTAQISSSASEDAKAPGRHRVLIRAIQATPGVEVFEGKFQVPLKWRSVAPRLSWQDRFRPSPNRMTAWMLDRSEARSERPLKVRVQVPEEKFTDVAMATHLVNDFHTKACDRAILVTNDGDLKIAVKLVVEAGHTVDVISPATSVNRELQREATSARPLRREILPSCQMQDRVALAKGYVERPKVWKKSTEAHP
ncbi:MAG: NYN domain-containing protein [Acidimicrobiaceae bacterium]|nr:NYN domain-containing protein [Acidimicrobiaceae bacterium]